MQYSEADSQRQKAGCFTGAQTERMYPKQAQWATGDQTREKAGRSCIGTAKTI